MTPAVGSGRRRCCAVDVTVLGARGGIGNGGAVLQNIAIARSSPAIGVDGEPAVVASRSVIARRRQWRPTSFVARVPRSEIAFDFFQ